METWQLTKALKTYKTFNGVYPLDYLTDIKVKYGGYIINTDPSNQPGEHWVAVYFDVNLQGEYFDSYGLPPLHSEIINFLKRKSDVFTFNQECLQSVSSNSCGYFCYLYLSFKLNGLSMNDYVDFFTNKPKVNELLLNYYKIKLLKV